MTLLSLIGDIGEVFTTYGWTGLLVLGIGAILYFSLSYIIKKSNKDTSDTLTHGFNSMTKHMENQNNLLIKTLIDQSAENNKMIGTIIQQVLDDKENKAKKDHEEKMNSRLNVSKIIRQKMHDLLNRYNADRIFILEFHNCKENITGLPFYWYDMVYEEIRKGMRNIHTAWRDQEASQLIPIIEDMEEFGGYKVYTIDDIEEFQVTTSILYSKLRVERDVKEAIISALYAHDNTLIGLLVFEYEFSTIPIEVLDDEDIISQATSIATLLDCRTSQETNRKK